MIKSRLSCGLMIIFLILFFIHSLYAESELEKALSEGWVIEVPQQSEEQSPAFVSFSFSVDSDAVNYLNPKNLIHNTPARINRIQTRYESDGNKIKNVDNEEWNYSEHKIQYSFESDSLINDVTENYDEVGRLVEEIREVRENGFIYQHRTFSYDEENQMLFWYEKDVLTYVITEYKDQDKSIYTQYSKTGKDSSYTIFYNKDKTISKIEDITYLPKTTQTSIITCEYSKGQIIRFVRYSESIDKIIMDIQYYYQDNQYIGSYDAVNKNRNEYSDFDIYGNWTTNSYFYDGVLQGIIKREISY